MSRKPKYPASSLVRLKPGESVIWPWFNDPFGATDIIGRKRPVQRMRAQIKRVERELHWQVEFKNEPTEEGLKVTRIR